MTYKPITKEHRHDFDRDEGMQQFDDGDWVHVDDVSSAISGLRNEKLHLESSSKQIKCKRCNDFALWYTDELLCRQCSISKWFPVFKDTGNSAYVNDIKTEDKK